MLVTGVGEAKDVADSMLVFLKVVEFLLPVIIVLCLIATIRFVWRRLKYWLQNKAYEKNRKDIIQRQINKNTTNRNKNINKLFASNKQMMQKLDNIGEPVDKSKYRELDITFDKNGRANVGGKR